MSKQEKDRIPLDDLLMFHQVARSLTTSFNLDTILRTIIEHMERFVEADLWTLLMLDERRKDLYYAIAAGGEEAALKNLRVKVGEGVAGWVAAHGETLIVPEAAVDPRAAKEKTHRAMRSVIALPLKGRQGTLGVIEIINPLSQQMTDYTIAFLHILSDYAAIAIENARDMTRIQQLTITDDTTGLYNVRHLYDVLGRELDRTAHSGKPLSLAFLDLDHFKWVNDAHRHLLLTGETGKGLDLAVVEAANQNTVDLERLQTGLAGGAKPAEHGPVAAGNTGNPLEGRLLHRIHAHGHAVQTRLLQWPGQRFQQMSIRGEGNLQPLAAGCAQG